MKLPLTYLIRTRSGQVIEGTFDTFPGDIVAGIKTRIAEALCLQGGISSPTREDECDRGEPVNDGSHVRKPAGKSPPRAAAKRKKS